MTNSPIYAAERQEKTCLLLVLHYIDPLCAHESTSTRSSLPVHRFIISAVFLSSKARYDVFCTPTTRGSVASLPPSSSVSSVPPSPPSTGTSPAPARSSSSATSRTRAACYTSSAHPPSTPPLLPPQRPTSAPMTALLLALQGIHRGANPAPRPTK